MAPKKLGFTLGVQPVMRSKHRQKRRKEDDIEAFERFKNDK